MRLLKRDTVSFRYYPYVGERETMDAGRHTGEMKPRYGVPFEYHGNLSSPSGFAQANLFGLNTPYTHVLLTETGVDIQEHGLIQCGTHYYDVTAVRPSANVMNIALRKRTENNAPEVENG